MVEETYPSGRVVKNTLDTNGMLQQVQSKKAGDTFRNYANSFNYTPAGAVSSVRLGNGRWENTTFNSRLQPTQIGLGSSATDTGLLKLDFEYGKLNWDGTVLAGTNNGNVAKQTITVPTVGSAAGFTAVQYYAYDALNRIQIASENFTQNGQSTVTSWTQGFTYDRYGNRRFDEANTTTITKNCTDGTNQVVCTNDVPVVNPQIDTTKNRLVGYSFDNAGNTKIDAISRQFIYDAENKQIEVKDSQGTSIGKYYYDGDGKWVKKEAGNETTIFIYDAAGKLVAEYSNQTNANPQISYLTTDHLGSPRITTGASGEVISRRDFQPFGEEIQRASYGNDDVKQKFTGYEKDDETDLDFAQARYFNSGIGRFSSPDSFTNDTHTSDPQSWNLYVYVRNNPLKYIDPTGKELWFRLYKVGEYKVVERDGRYVLDGADGNNESVIAAETYLNRMRNGGQEILNRLLDGEGNDRTNVVYFNGPSFVDEADGHVMPSQNDSNIVIVTNLFIAVSNDEEESFRVFRETLGIARDNLGSNFYAERDRDGRLLTGSKIKFEVKKEEVTEVEERARESAQEMINIRNSGSEGASGSGLPSSLPPTSSTPKKPPCAFGNTTNCEQLPNQ